MFNENIDELSDKELIKGYFKAFDPEVNNMLMAGIYAGRLHERGYEIIYKDNKETFVKKNKKVA